MCELGLPDIPALQAARHLPEHSAPLADHDPLAGLRYLDYSLRSRLLDALLTAGAVGQLSNRVHTVLFYL